jgi:hypothetical protein
MAIKSIEWLGFFEAQKINVQSDWMRDEIIRIYKVPQEKIVIIPVDDPSSHTKQILSLFSDVARGAKVK